MSDLARDVVPRAAYGDVIRNKGGKVGPWAIIAGRPVAMGSQWTRPDRPYRYGASPIRLRPVVSRNR